METKELQVDTSGARLVDLTDSVRAFCRPLGDGLLNVFVPHATAGIAVIETGAGTEEDLEALLDRLLPRDDSLYRHRHGSPGHGADHILPAIISPSLTVPVVAGAPALGVWQHIVLVDLNRDNPLRTVRLAFVP
jgi:secondary thiamine-phosphate synthase enzyme